ncbi:hypothetical protein SDC9_106320 [bioreactor metagenome]|uniref:Uncharacterized protein n=1 Tax=bioreactor metagenome TaxID=1076179 RepID=A0A645B320_9ZZZZ
MAGERLGRGERRNLATEHFADRAQLGHVAHRGGGAVRIDVVDAAVNAVDGLAHAGNRAVAGGCHHVFAVAGRAKADHFAEDVGAARQSVLQAFQHHRAATTSDHETIAVRIVGTRCLLRRGVVLAGHRAHAVEQQRHAPGQFLAAAGEHHVLHAPGNLLSSSADAVRRGAARRGDGVVDALDLVVG